MTTGATTPDLELERLRHRAERERLARLEAERVAEAGTRQLYDRQQQAELLHVIASAASAVISTEAAIQVVLDQFCAYTGWPVGHAWLVSESVPPVLVPTTLWHLDQPERFITFRQITESKLLSLDEGLPGRVFASKTPAWIQDVTCDTNFPGARDAREIGVRGAFAFPVLAGSRVVAVIEFFLRETAEPQPSWLHLAEQAGTHLGRVFERKRAEAELAAAHSELLEASREAGKAEVATGVLHNVGNVLNSVNVSATVLASTLKKSKAAHVGKVAAMLREHQADLGTFLTTDAKGKQVPGFLGTLAEGLAAEQAQLLEELAGLQKNIEHIKDVVAMQQTYAKVTAVIERVRLEELIEDALRLNASSLSRHDVRVVKDFAPVPPVMVDKHKLLQILVNLLRNAKQACEDAGREDKQLTLRLAVEGDRVRISVSDNGVGIPAENLTRIFKHGFTTKKHGHGFGLHSGANAAREMGGLLTVHSEGAGCGATFMIELPVKPGQHGTAPPVEPLKTAA